MDVKALIFVPLILVATSCDSALKVKTVGTGTSGSTLVDASEKPIVVSPNETLVLEGSVYSPDARVVIDGQEVEVFRTESGEIGVKLPSALATKKVQVSISQGGRVAVLNNVFALNNDDFPLITASEEAICNNQRFYNADGTLVWGKKVCEINDANLKPENIKAGVTIVNVEGTLKAEMADCDQDGAINCVANSSYAAAKIRGLAAKVVKNAQVAGVAGTLTTVTTEACTFDGQQGCVTNAAYPAADTQGLRSKITEGNRVAGVLGSVRIPASSQVQLGVAFGSDSNKTGALTLPLPNQVKGGVTYGAPGSTLSGSIANCSANGQDDCFLDQSSSYDAAVLTNLIPGNIRAGITIADITGSVVIPAPGNVGSGVTYGTGGTEYTGTASVHVDCTGAGQSGCVATTTYQTMDLTNKDAGGALDLNSTDFDTRIASNNLFEYWDENGVRFTANGDADLTAANVRQGTTLLHVTGDLRLPAQGVVHSPVGFGHQGTEFTGTATVHTNCTAAGQQGCLATATYQTMDLSNNNAGGATDLNDPDFGTRIASSSLFEYWDENGVRHTANGDADLVAGNIKNGVTILGVGGDYPSSTHPLPGAGTHTGLDPTTFESQLTSAASFEYWQADGTHRSGAGDADIIAAKIKSGVDIFSTTGTFTGPPPVVTTISGTVASISQIDLSWTDMSASGYLVVANEGSAVTFVPTNGTSYSTGSQGADEIIYVGSGTSFNHTSLNQFSTYHYAVYAYDGADDYSSSAATTFRAIDIDCSGLPGGVWVGVPGDADYHASDFCVMKYEARQNGADPLSSVTGTPWVSINQTQAIDACDNLAGVELMTNDHWMTIAANIAQVGDNWSTGTVGTGILNRGHSDSAPSAALAASTDDDGCFGTGDTCDDATWHIQRRTNRLSTGAIIWDIGGNVLEWTSFTLAGGTGKPTPDGNNWTEYTAVANGTVLNKDRLVLTNALKGFWDNSWDSDEGIGMYYPGNEGSGGSLYRGGYFDAGHHAGIFRANLDIVATHNWTDLGFRCVAPVP